MGGTEGVRRWRVPVPPNPWRSADPSPSSRKSLWRRRSAETSPSRIVRMFRKRSVLRIRRRFVQILRLRSATSCPMRSADRWWRRCPGTSKKVTKVVCEEKQMDEMKTEPSIEAGEGIPDIDDILEIFGITNTDYENEIEIDDGLLSSSTTTSTTTTVSTTSTPRTPEFIPTSSSTRDSVRRMDESKIIFSDDEISSRNKDLANRVYAGRLP